MRDYFEILGLSSNAGAREVRRAHARHVRREHPDFRGTVQQVAGAATAPDPGGADLAIDFLDMKPIVDRMQVAFFGTSAGPFLDTSPPFATDHDSSADD